MSDAKVKASDAKVKASEEKVKASAVEVRHGRCATNIGEAGLAGPIIFEPLAVLKHIFYFYLTSIHIIYKVAKPNHNVVGPGRID